MEMLILRLKVAGTCMSLLNLIDDLIVCHIMFYIFTTFKAIQMEMISWFYMVKRNVLGISINYFSAKMYQRHVNFVNILKFETIFDDLKFKHLDFI